MALQKAKEIDVLTIGFGGHKGGKMKSDCDIFIAVPSNNTPRIQEMHIMVGQIFCDLIEHGLSLK